MTTLPIMVHLSDLHFGWEHYHDSEKAEALKQHLTETKPYPNFILVTGDLSQFARKKELEGAKKYLEEITQELEGKGISTRYIAVPGNHDVGLFKRLGNWQKTFGNGGGPQDCSLCPQDLKAYYENCRNCKPDEAEALGREAITFCEYYPSFQTVFLKFNSNLLTGGWLQNYARGKVGNSQLLKVSKILQDFERAFPEFVNARRIALVHHHVQYLPNPESDILMLMKDAGRFWKSLIDLKVELILHGHKHYSTHLGLNYSHLGEKREMMILAAGSSTSKDQPQGQTCSYYKINCDPFGYNIENFSINGNSFNLNSLSPLHHNYLPQLHLDEPYRSIDKECLQLMAFPDTKEIDHQNIYDEIICRPEIDSSLNYIGNNSYRGTNQSKDTLTQLIIPIVAVGINSKEELDLKAYIGPDKRPCGEPRVVDHRLAASKFIISVGIDSVDPGDQFEVCLTFKISKAMRRGPDFDAINFARFPQGLRNFKYVLKSHYRLLNPRCYLLHRNGAKSLNFIKTDYDIKAEIVETNSLGFGFLFSYEGLAV